MKAKTYVTLFVILYLSAVITGCGVGTSSDSGPTSGPSAITNGSSLTTSTTYWDSQSCTVKVQLTTDGTFVSVMTDSGRTFTAQGLWTANGNDLQTDLDSAPSGFFLVTSMSNIAGSTKSRSFSAGVTTKDDTGTSRTIPSCSFTLQQGTLRQT